jgi:hypothetical protein
MTLVLSSTGFSRQNSFPHGSILDCPTTTRGSYAWQSILKARDVISRGAVWRVGNGESINIWRDRWLLEDHHRRIITPGPNLLVHSTVNELITKPQMVWDHSLIDSLFIPYDAEAIKHIPLSNHKHADKITWPGNMNGEYSVRSGYRFLVDEEDKASLVALGLILGSPFEVHLGSQNPKEMPNVCLESLPRSITHQT